MKKRRKRLLFATVISGGGGGFDPTVNPPILFVPTTATVDEGATLSIPLAANESVTWSKVGGADQARFEISGSTLRWLSNGVKDYEAPDDADANNTYIVTIRATDLQAMTTDRTITVTVNDVESPVIVVPPMLTLTSAASDNTPDFTLAGDLVIGDTIRFQYSTSAVFSGASELTNTIDAGEDAADSISFATGTLANNTWYFRARTERPEHDASDWSNTESIAISVASYTGPGDLVSGWAVWYGIRAFSSATIGNALIRVKRADAAEQDIVSASNGILNVADSFFNGSTPYEIVKMYDQAGTGKHLDALIAGTTYPQLILNDKGTLPCIHSFRHNTPNSQAFVHYTVASLTQPYSVSCVARVITPYGESAIISYGEHPVQIGFSATPGNITIFGGTAHPEVSGAPIGVTHSLQALYSNTASKICIDGTSTTVSIADTRASGTVYAVFPTAGVYAKTWEAGWCAGDISSSFAALTANQQSVWNLLTVLPATWDPLTEAGLLVLSGGNLVVTLTNSASFYAVRGTNNASTGKYYFEVTPNTALSGQPMFVGIANAFLPTGVGDPIGIGSNNGIAYDTAGYIWLNGTPTGVGTPAVMGDTLCIAVDLGAKLFWARKNAGSWNNSGTDNPATATGGVSFATMNAGPYLPAIALGNVPSGTVTGTANFGSTAYAQTKPSGFSDW